MPSALTVEREVAQQRLAICRKCKHYRQGVRPTCGTPIVGDKLYGPDREIFLRAAAGELTDWDREQLILDRHALHSARLVFHSPANDGPTCIESGLPDDLVDAFPQFAG